jgi:uncharacterized sulfatase
MAQGKPNILFIFSDQQRADTLGCYGQPLEVTPNLDRLAAQGVRFENAFTCQPVCGPARSCLQTGRWATETGVYRNNISLRFGEKTIAHHLKQQGYEVGYIGKWHLASNFHGPSFLPPQGDEEDYHHSPIPAHRRGGYMDYWLASDALEFTSHGYDGHLFDGDMNKVSFTGYRVDCLTDFALEYLNKRREEKPFFLFLSYLEPHHQNDHKHYEGPKGSKERFRDFVPPPDLVGLEGDWAEEYPDYLGCCASIDRNVGRLLEALQHLGLEEDTLIVYTSDHGSHFQTRNNRLDPGSFDDYKRSCHDGCLRIPMVLNGPGFRGGSVVRELVSLIDLPPTILATAGLDTPEQMHGHPLQRILNGMTTEWREEIFAQISESQVGRMIRTEKWKYSVRAPGLDGVHHSASQTYQEEFLYNLEDDPVEHNNLVRDSSLSSVRAELADRLKRCMAEAGEAIPEILPSEDAD